MVIKSIKNEEFDRNKSKKIIRSTIRGPKKTIDKSTEIQLNSNNIKNTVLWIIDIEEVNYGCYVLYRVDDLYRRQRTLTYDCK